ncbi:MAG: hypothetical protein ABII64_01025 [Elusimicrobiota bacterium]
MKKAIYIALILFLAISAQAATDIYLSLSAHGKRLDIGLAGFNPLTPSMDELKISRQLMEILRYDILFSRYFNVVEGGPPFTGTEQNSAEWGNRGAEILISGEIRVKGDILNLTCKLIDVESRQSVWQKEFKARTDECRELGHLLNDEIIYRLTGEKGIAHTKIVFANRNGPGKEICIIDYDGGNLRRLTKNSSINMFPRWSPDGGEIIFTTYLYGNPDLYAVAPSGSGFRPVSFKQGLNATGSFSTDGHILAVTLSLGKDPSIYLLERSGKIIRQLTFGKGIETSPSFSPNGKEISFISDQSGYPQVYIMSLDGGNVRKLPAKGYCDSPAWSPRGDRIVFVMREGRGDYDLYLYDLASDGITKLTRDEGSNENPSWSPDGRFIVFSSNRSGRNELYIIGADGSGARKLGNIGGNSYMPSWGP